MWETWFNLFDNMIDKFDLDYVITIAFPIIMELPALKNPFPKRKKGNRLAVSFARQVGEIGFDKEPNVLRLI